MTFFPAVLFFSAVVAFDSYSPTLDALNNTASHTLVRNEAHHIRSFLPATRTSLSPTSRDGFTFDDCETTEDCCGDRLCFNFESDETKLCSGETDCVCGPRDGLLILCNDNDNCEQGEVCSSTGNDRLPFCWSADYAQRLGLTIYPTPPGDGYTRDLCSDDLDCRDSRSCKLATDVSEVCEQGNYCFCIPPKVRACCIEGECISEEVCAKNTARTSPIPFCVSPLTLVRDSDWQLVNCSTEATPEPSPSPNRDPRPDPTPSPPNPTPNPPNPTRTAPTPSGTASGLPVTIPPLSSQPTARPEPPFVTDPPPPVCISVHLLEYLSESELVFRKHAWAKVLCDAQTSCATPGHMVVYKGRAMMMASYCKIVGCSRRVMQVNSPRYRRKLRVPSMTDGLEFTSFAARYETILEQHVMAFGMKMGL